MKTCSLITATFLILVTTVSIAAPINESFVHYLLYNAKVGDRVDSFEWGKSSKYTVVEKKQEGDKTFVYLKKRNGAGVVWSHIKGDPLDCSEEGTEFCKNAHFVSKQIQ